MLMPMSKKSHQKAYEVSKEGRITIYPALYGVSEGGKLKRILKKLIHIHKGH